MKMVTIIGARPQFIKAAPVSRAITEHNRLAPQTSHLTQVLVHTGQHFDTNMSDIFFKELEIPEPDHHLGIGGGRHGAMTGRMLEKIEELLLVEKPDWVFVHGDTNSTLAGALAAVKLHIPVAHIEAGLRSFNRRMPEEINRILADHMATLLFCPCRNAVKHLMREGITARVHNVGDVMFDAVLHYRQSARETISLSRWGLNEGQYALCTIHRAENTDDPARLREILCALDRIAADLPVVLPLHPRTARFLRERNEASLLDRLCVLQPVSYLEMLRLEMSAAVILTDSGGVQKEAFFHKVPCLTLRDETEWVETVEMGWNRICGAESERILEARETLTQQERDSSTQPYGDGKAAERIVEILLELK